MKRLFSLLLCMAMLTSLALSSTTVYADITDIINESSHPAFTVEDYFTYFEENYEISGTGAPNNTVYSISADNIDHSIYHDKYETYNHVAEGFYFGNSPYMIIGYNSQTETLTIDASSELLKYSILLHEKLNYKNLIINRCNAIPEYLFYDNDSLENVTLPGNLKEIGPYAFYGCDNLKSVVHNASAEAWNSIDIAEGNDYLVSKYYESLPEPEPVINVDFNEATSTVTISGSGKIPSHFFYKMWCNGITIPYYKAEKVIIEEGITSIEKSAFKSLMEGSFENARTFTLPATLTSIGENAFSDCTVIETVNYNGTPEQWKSINIEPGNETLCYETPHGYCGTSDVTWNFDRTSGVLTISGEGDWEPLRLNTEEQRWYEIKDSVKTIVIEDGITYIPASAFKDHHLLERIEIADSVKYIEGFAFEGCGNLKEIILPESLESISTAAFSDCYSLESISIPDSVSDLGNFAFSNCSSLKEVSLPAGIKSIGWRLFYECSSLTHVTIPDGVTTIAYSAFENCTSLSSVYIPLSVTNIDTNAFYNCSSLRNVQYGGDAASWENIDIASGNDYLISRVSNVVMEYDPKTKTIRVSGSGAMLDFYDAESSLLYQFRNEVKRVVIEEGVTTIGENAFNGGINITEVILPSSLKTIKPSAFSKCSSLKSIVLPESLTSIEDGAFVSCTNLKSITLPKNLTKLGVAAFSGCTSLESLVIPEGITVLETDVISYCSSLKELTIPTSMKTLKGNPATGEYNQGLTVYYLGTEDMWWDINRHNISWDLITLVCLGNQIFEDVALDAWYAEYTAYAYENGLMKGTSDTTFAPEAAMDRSMVVTVLYRIATPSEFYHPTNFNDLKEDWYLQPVAWAYYNGVVKGVSDKKFDPSAPVTREQLATFLYRFSSYMGYDMSASAELTSFPDSGNVSDWATDALEWAVAEGLITGSNEGGVLYLNPNGTATRAQVATILTRFCKKH